jgi:hypothetical protein
MRFLRLSGDETWWMNWTVAQMLERFHIPWELELPDVAKIDLNQLLWDPADDTDGVYVCTGIGRNPAQRAAIAGQIAQKIDNLWNPRDFSCP